jgi:hypothetical protein
LIAGGEGDEFEVILIDKATERKMVGLLWMV